MARDARAAVRARVPAVRGARSASAGSTSRSRPTRRACSGSCASCTTRPASGAGWRSGSAGAGVPSLEGALRELQLAPVHDALRAAIAAPPRPRRSSGSSRPSPMPPGRAATGRRSSTPSLALVTPRPSPSRRRSTTPRRRRRCALWALLAAARVAAVGRRRGRDEPGVVRGAAARAGRGRRAARPAASTRRARGGPRSGSGCCWTCRCRRRSAASADGLPLRLVDAWLADPVGALVPADQPLGRRGLVPPRVVARARRLDRSPRARADAARGAGPAAGRAIRPRPAAGGGRRGVRLPGRRRCARRWRRRRRRRRRQRRAGPRACRRPPASRPARRTRQPTRRSPAPARLGRPAARPGRAASPSRRSGSGCRRCRRTPRWSPAPSSPAPG